MLISYPRSDPNIWVHFQNTKSKFSMTESFYISWWAIFYKYIFTLKIIFKEYYLMFIIDVSIKTIISILNICLEKVRWIYQSWMNINHIDSSNMNKLLIHSPTWTIKSVICTADGENVGKCILNAIYIYTLNPNIYFCSIFMSWLYFAVISNKIISFQFFNY